MKLFIDEFPSSKVAYMSYYKVCTRTNSSSTGHG